MNLKKKKICFTALQVGRWSYLMWKEELKKRDKYTTITVDLIFSIEMPGNQNTNFDKTNS